MSIDGDFLKQPNKSKNRKYDIRYQNTSSANVDANKHSGNKEGKAKPKEKFHYPVFLAESYKIVKSKHQGKRNKGKWRGGEKEE